MKKHFLISALCILSFFNLQSEDTEEVESSMYIIYATDFMPFAQRWFEELKEKHADAGFDNATFLREGYFINGANQIIPVGWCAARYINPNDALKLEFNNLECIKLICNDKNELIKLNNICQRYYEKFEEFSVEDQEYLNSVEAIFLHEIYHCLHMPKTHNKYFNDIHSASKVGLGCASIAYAIAYFGTQNETHKKYALHAIIASTAGLFTTLALIATQSIYNMRQNEYEADMHAIKYGNAQTYKGFILFFKNIDESCEKAGWKIFNPTIKKVEALQENAWDISKPSYAALVYILKNMQNFYIDKNHPSAETRIQYFTEALENSQQ